MKIDLENMLISSPEEVLDANIRNSPKKYLEHLQEHLLILSQDEFIDKCNKLGKIMCSMADLYETIKSTPSKQLKIIRELLTDNTMITSTRIIHSKETFNHKGANIPTGKIVHNYESKIITPVEFTIAIPEYSPYCGDDYLIRHSAGYLLFGNRKMK